MHGRTLVICILKEYRRTPVVYVCFFGMRNRCLYVDLRTYMEFALEKIPGMVLAFILGKAGKNMGNLMGNIARFVFFGGFACCFELSLSNIIIACPRCW
jgi:hypothetical protein